MMTKTEVKFYRHMIDQECVDELAKVVEGIFITTGPKTAIFENQFSQYLGLPHSVGMMSCTHALHMAYVALGVGPGDEVIVPAFTFVASVSSILHAGATPVLVDVDPKTGIIDPDLVEKAITKKTRAICPVHLYGVMAPMKRLREIADRNNLLIVEDAAHCIEGRGEGFGPGTLADAVAFSFYATKNITCGEGGALATRHEEVAKKVKALRNHGMNKNAADRHGAAVPIYDVAELGYKSNMTDINASLLLPQLKRIEENWKKRDHIVKMYNEGLAGTPGIELPFIPDGQKSAHHLYTIRVSSAEKRDDFVAAMIEEGIECSINYRPLTELTYFKEKLSLDSSDYPFATSIGNRVVTLPLYPSLSNSEVELVIDGVRSVAGKFFS